MSENGNRPQVKPPASASPSEAAAIIAAVERFIAETTAAPEQAEAAGPWQRAALLEGIAAKAAFGPADASRDPWA